MSTSKYVNLFLSVAFSLLGAGQSYAGNYFAAFLCFVVAAAVTYIEHLFCQQDDAIKMADECVELSKTALAEAKELLALVHASKGQKQPKHPQHDIKERTEGRKLTVEQENEMRALYEKGAMQRDLAEKYGVCLATVSQPKGSRFGCGDFTTKCAIPAEPACFPGSNRQRLWSCLRTE